MGLIRSPWVDILTERKKNKVPGKNLSHGSHFNSPFICLIYILFFGVLSTFL